MNNKIGVLLVNLGSPLSPSPKDVYRYLIEFLTDARVMDLPWWKRQLIVRGFIVPQRYRQSAKLYQQIWTDQGSPLIVHGYSVRDQLQTKLGEGYEVALAMRYQHPSIRQGLDQLRKKQVGELIVLPLFPQYASATTGSIYQKVMEEIGSWQSMPSLRFISNFADEPHFIQALAERGRQYELTRYDHILFSFHGLPEKQIVKGSPSHTCLSESCCFSRNKGNQLCYKAQCYATSRALVEALALKPGQFTLCFQSRLGNDPWIKPYASDVLKECAEKGYKNILVFSPSFVADCLETISEIGHEYAEEFRRFGGQRLDLVEGLNAHPSWIEALKSLVIQ